MKNKRTNKGITLIALVITIIVMLILVAVTINMAINGGLFSNAGGATTSLKAESEKEQITVGYSQYLIKKMTGETPILSVEGATVEGNEETAKEWVVTFEKSGNQYCISKKDGSVLPPKGEVTAAAEVAENADIYYGAYISNYGVAIDTASAEDENVKLASLENSNFVANGAKVQKLSSIKVATSETDSEVSTTSNDEDDVDSGLGFKNYNSETDGIENEPHQTDWRIFYSDGKNIYLIASDYVKLDFTKLTGITKYTTDYNGYFNDNLGKYDLQYMTGTLFAQDGLGTKLANNLKNYNYNYYNAVPKMQPVAYMLDTSVWADYANSEFASFAIGGPTLEMYANSYNSKNNRDLITVTGTTSGCTFSGSHLYSDNLYLQHNDKADAMYLSTRTAMISDGREFVGSRNWSCWSVGK